MKCNTCGKMNCMAHGGDVEDNQMKTYAMSPDVPSMRPKTMAKGGEAELDVDMDHDDGMDMDEELNDMVAEELLHAIETKDKKGILESIRALVMNCGGMK